MKKKIPYEKTPFDMEIVGFDSQGSRVGNFPVTTTIDNAPETLLEWLQFFRKSQSSCVRTAYIAHNGHVLFVLGDIRSACVYDVKPFNLEFGND